MKTLNPFGLVVQMSTAWNDQMFKHWIWMSAAKQAPGLVKPERVDEAMADGLKAEQWRAYWYAQG